MRLHRASCTRSSPFSDRATKGKACRREGDVPGDEGSSVTRTRPILFPAGGAIISGCSLVQVNWEVRHVAYAHSRNTACRCTCQSIEGARQNRPESIRADLSRRVRTYLSVGLFLPQRRRMFVHLRIGRSSPRNEGEHLLGGYASRD